jgi:hypothetical protein
MGTTNPTRALGVYQHSGFGVARTWIDYGMPVEL